MAKKKVQKKEEFDKYVDKTRKFVKEHPITSVLIGAVFGYSIGRLIHKRSKR